MTSELKMVAPNLFLPPIEVRNEDLDMNNHFNNEIYLKWIMQIASLHSEHVGHILKKVSNEFLQEQKKKILEKVSA